LLEELGSRVRGLRLEVNQMNTEAIKLYEDLGFKRMSVIENYYADGSPAVKMQLAIRGTFHSSQTRRKMAK
jgi:ribosomal protein S18 acetylase RimI-like enzyme